MLTVRRAIAMSSPMRWMRFVMSAWKVREGPRSHSSRAQRPAGAASRPPRPDLPGRTPRGRSFPAPLAAEAASSVAAGRPPSGPRPAPRGRGREGSCAPATARPSAPEDELGRAGELHEAPRTLVRAVDGELEPVGLRPLARTDENGQARGVHEAHRAEVEHDARRGRRAGERLLELRRRAEVELAVHDEAHDTVVAVRVYAEVVVRVRAHGGCVEGCGAIWRGYAAGGARDCS